MSETLDASQIVAALNAYDGVVPWREFAASLDIDFQQAADGMIPVGDGRLICYVETARQWAVSTPEGDR